MHKYQINKIINQFFLIIYNNKNDIPLLLKLMCHFSSCFEGRIPPFLTHLYALWIPPRGPTSFDITATLLSRVSATERWYSLLSNQSKQSLLLSNHFVTILILHNRCFKIFTSTLWNPRALYETRSTGYRPSFVSVTGMSVIPSFIIRYSRAVRKRCFTVSSGWYLNNKDDSSKRFGDILDGDILAAQHSAAVTLFSNSWCLFTLVT